MALLLVTTDNMRDKGHVGDPGAKRKTRKGHRKRKKKGEGKGREGLRNLQSYRKFGAELTFSIGSN